ncbi:hypothetical protein P5774_27915, partial [Bacillus tropicus]
MIKVVKTILFVQPSELAELNPYNKPPKPTLSGYIVEYYDWRLLFEMILPLAIISLLLGIWKSENVMRQN